MYWPYGSVFLKKMKLNVMCLAIACIYGSSHLCGK